MIRDKTGLWGEIYTSRYMREMGMDIYCANYKCRMGEIDLASLYGGYFCVVEVKTRHYGSDRAPSDSVDRKKRERIAATTAFLMKHEGIVAPVRFDVVEVWLGEDYRLVEINYIENAYESGE